MYHCMQLKTKISNSERNASYITNALAIGILCTTIQAFSATPTDNCQLVFADSQAAILRADSVTGVSQVVSQGEKLMQPYGIAVGLSGEVFVSDTGCSGLFGINPSTGEQRLICTG